MTWHEPPWKADLDTAAALAAVPGDATMNGLFLSSVAAFARSRGVTLPSARASYIPFRPYPLRDHATLLVEAARLVYVDEPIRQGLRHLGRGAPATLVRSMLGRIVLGSVEGPLDVMRAMAKAYPLESKPGSLTVTLAEPGRCVVEVRDIYTFLDSHHVGVFEGAMRFAGVEGSVHIRSYSSKDADLSCVWTSTSDLC